MSEVCISNYTQFLTHRVCSGKSAFYLRSNKESDIFFQLNSFHSLELVVVCCVHVLLQSFWIFVSLIVQMFLYLSPYLFRDHFESSM